MSYCILTINRTIFLRRLAHAPEELRREAEKQARRAIPNLCFTEDDIRQRFAEEKQWKALSEEEQHEAIELLIYAGEYEHAGTTANQSIAEAVARYLNEAFNEEILRQE